MIRNPLLKLTLCAVTFGCLGLGQLFAQSESFAAQNRQNEEPLQMIVTYGDGKQKRRVSRHGIMEPVGFPIGQPVAITLQFLRNRAGEVVQILSRDGGVVDLQTPATISAEGTLSFTFQTGRTPGLYRLTVNGPQQYELSLYGVDPNRPSQSSGN